MLRAVLLFSLVTIAVGEKPPCSGRACSSMGRGAGGATRKRAKRKVGSSTVRLNDTLDVIRNPATAAAHFSRTFRTRKGYDSYVDKLIKRIRRPAKGYADLNPSDGPYKDAGLSMSDEGMLRKLQKQLESIADRGIVGDIYETGTWRAGTAMFMVGVLTAYESLLANQRTPRLVLRPERHYWFFDSFAGFHSGQGMEIGSDMDTHLQNPIYVAPLDRVMR